MRLPAVLGVDGLRTYQGNREVTWGLSGTPKCIQICQTNATKNSPEVAHSSGTSKACMYVDIVLKCASILKGWSHPKAQRLCIADSTSRKLASASPSCCSRYWGWNLGMKQAVAGLCSAKAGPDAAAAQCVQGTHPNSGGVALEEGPPMSGHSCTENHHQVEKHHKQCDYNGFFLVYIYTIFIT